MGLERHDSENFHFWVKKLCEIIFVLLTLVSVTSSLLFSGTHLGLDIWDLLEGERHVSGSVLKPWLSCVGKWVSSSGIWVSSSFPLAFWWSSLSSSKSLVCLKSPWVKTCHLEQGESCWGDRNLSGQVEMTVLSCVSKFIEPVLAGMSSWLSFSTHTTGCR